MPRARYGASFSDRLLATAIALITALLAGCATNPVTGDREVVLMSEERELELGERFHEQITEQKSVYEDEALQRYVADIGQALADVSHRSDIDYTFTVLEDPQVNAFALPGGYIYVTTGILGYFNSEAALAGVLGHEIGHVTARHAVQRQTAATATNILGAVLLAESGAGVGGRQLFEVAQLAAIRGYGREQELQSDRLGAQYLARAGYDSEAMLDVIKMLADQRAFAQRQAAEEGREPGGYHGLFATHPENDVRRKEVIRAARQYEAANPRPPGRAAYLQRIDGLPFASSADGGVVIDRVFLHAPLDAALEAPKDWTITNRPDRLIFHSPDDDARLEARVRRLDGDASARALLAKRIGDAEGGRRLERGRFSGYTLVRDQRTRDGVRPVRHVMVRKNDQAWYFVGLTRRPEAFEGFDRDFLEIVATLDDLDAEQRRRAKPPRIDVVEAESGQTYAELARRAPPSVDDPVEQLRLLNGDFPNGEPRAGQLVKILR